MRMKPIKVGSALILTALLVSVVPIADAAQVTEKEYQKEYQSFAQTSQQYHNIARQVIRMRKLTKLSLQQREAKIQYRRLSQQDFIRYVHGLAFDLTARRSEKNAKLPSKFDIAQSIALNDLARDTFVNLPPLFIPTPERRLGLWARIANTLYPTDLVGRFPDFFHPSLVTGIDSEEARRLQEDIERLKEQLESTRALFSDLHNQHEILISVHDVGQMLMEVFDTIDSFQSQATDQFSTSELIGSMVVGAASGAAAGTVIGAMTTLPAGGVGAAPTAGTLGVAGAVGGAVSYVGAQAWGWIGRNLGAFLEAAEDKNNNGIPDCQERGDCKYLSNDSNSNSTNTICSWCPPDFFRQLNLGSEFEQDATFYLRLILEFGYHDNNLILRQ